MASFDSQVGERVKRTVEEAAGSREGKLAAGAAAATAAAVVARRLTADDGADAQAPGPSRTYRLKRREDEAHGIRRVARGRIACAVELLRDPDADPVEAVHEARKDMKKLRAALKLVRPVLGDDVYRTENQRFRDAARELSDVRDAQARAETVDALAERFADQPPPGGWAKLRGALASDEGADDGELDSLRGHAATEIARGDDEVDRWPLDEEGFDLLEPGLRRAYSRGRRRFREAKQDPSDVALHEWRKRAKDLWYHLRLVRNAWKPVLGPAADEAHELSDRLGDDHDLVVLGEYLDRGETRLTAAQLDHLRRRIDERRPELQAEAFAYGERLFAEKPKAFVKRIGRYWAAGSI